MIIINLTVRSMSLGVKDTWNCIMSLGRTGRGYIGTRVILRSLLKITPTMTLPEMTKKISIRIGSYDVTSFIAL